jgi:hypothetical protein
MDDGDSNIFFSEGNRYRFTDTVVIACNKSELATASLRQISALSGCGVGSDAKPRRFRGGCRRCSFALTPAFDFVCGAFTFWCCHYFFQKISG